MGGQLFPAGGPRVFPTGRPVIVPGWGSAAAPAIPDQYPATIEGWALTDGELSDRHAGGPRLEVGEQYLYLAARTYSSQRGWVVLVSAVFSVDDYGRAQRHEWSEPSLAGNAFVGALPWQVSRTLSTTGADPQVSRYAHLEPWERLLAIDFVRLPGRPGFLKATREKVIGGQLGYVREADWELLQRTPRRPGRDARLRRGGQPVLGLRGRGITLEGHVQQD